MVHSPSNWAWAANSAPPKPHSYDPALQTLIAKLHRDGLVHHSLLGFSPNARAFAKPKSADKGALIIDMRTINARCSPDTPRFQLPTLERLKASLSQPPQSPIYFCKLDIANHFWTCKLPADQKDSIRIGVNGCTYSLPSLPFGWTCSPALAQTLLGSYLATIHHPRVVQLQYLDDVLLFSMGAPPILAKWFTTYQRRGGFLATSPSPTLPLQFLAWENKSTANKNTLPWQARTWLPWLYSGLLSPSWVIPQRVSGVFWGNLIGRTTFKRASPLPQRPLFMVT